MNNNVIHNHHKAWNNITLQNTKMKFFTVASLVASVGAFQMPNNNRNAHITNVVAQESTKEITAIATAAGIFTMVALSPLPASAVSGGGLDYAGTDISGQDFSNSKAYKGKDFTQTIAKGTNFSGSNLQGNRFYRAYLVGTNFEGADIRGAALEDTSMDGANLKNANCGGTYFSASLLDVATAEGADFTDASIPPKALASFCEREDVKGVNPVTGNDTRETLMCPP